MSEFKETGVGSRAWYIKVIKNNPDRSGFSFIRNENIDGYKLNYPLLKSHMEELTAAGYFQKQGRDDSPRVKYVVTSFGHRYLEQHKDELEDIKPEPVYEKREGMYYRDKKLISRLMVPKHIADKLDGNVDGPVIVKKPASSPAPEQRSEPVSGRETAADEESRPPERPIDRVANAGITLGQEIEKHKAAVSKSPDSDTTAPASITPDTPATEHHDSKSDASTLPKNANSDNLAADVKEKLKDLLLEKFLDKTLDQVLSFKSISIHDFLAYVEKSE